MTQQKFNEGDLVRLKQDMPWKVVDGEKEIREYPVFWKVYTVSGYAHFYKGEWFINLKEISAEISFAEVDFAPVATRVRAMQQERDFILNLN